MRREAVLAPVCQAELRLSVRGRIHLAVVSASDTGETVLEAESKEKCRISGIGCGIAGHRA